MMDNKLEPTDVPGIFRDTSSGALINKNVNDLIAYRKKKRAAEIVNSLEETVSTQQKQIAELSSDVGIIKNQLAEVIGLLKQL